jgi:hypothetical protein
MPLLDVGAEGIKPKPNGWLGGGWGAVDDWPPDISEVNELKFQ